MAASGPSYDVVVVGAGNAALCAALSAQENGARVLVLECAPEEESGGNSRFTAGAMRVVYNGVEDIEQLMPDLTEEEKRNTDFGTCTHEQFFDDMARVTQYRGDPDLIEILVGESLPTLKWMRQKGVRFVPIYGRQAFKIEGKFKFWGGLTVEAWGGGPGLVEALTASAKRHGIDVWFESRAIALLHDDSGVQGVRLRRQGKTEEVRAGAVVLAAGGFQANTEWRTRYLGPNWDLAKVRGTRFNVDEGADFRNYTYAKYGRVILEQPGQFAWQVFDNKVLHLLRDEYRIKQVTKVTANSLEELVQKLDDVDADAALAEIKAYNASVRQDVPFNPNIKDGRRTEGLLVDKTNWANTIDEPPFHGYAVTCGVTFTFGGLRIDTEAHVMDVLGESIPGLYAAGELVGGIFYFNYPGGAGLTNGGGFGKIAGPNAAQYAKGMRRQ